jgi:hypothetical protein
VRATGESDGGAIGGVSGGSDKEKDKGAKKGPASSGLSTGAFTVGEVADRSTPGGWLAHNFRRRKSSRLHMWLRITGTFLRSPLRR